MKYPKVVIGAPIHIYKDYCIRPWLDYVCTLPYPNYEVIVVDNSEDRNWHKQFIGMYPNLTVETYYASNRKIGKRHITIQEILAACQNKIVTFAKRKGAEYVLSHECDNFFKDKNFLPRLISHNKLVVGGFYQHGFGDKRFHMIQVVDQPVFGTNLVHNKIREADFREVTPQLTGDLIEAHGFGIGGVLIDMELFNQTDIKFRSDIQGKGLSDSYFYYDLTARDIPAFIDTGLNLEHVNDSWGWKKAVHELKGTPIV